MGRLVDSSGELRGARPSRPAPRLRGASFVPGVSADAAAQHSVAEAVGVIAVSLQVGSAWTWGGGFDLGELRVGGFWRSSSPNVLLFSPNRMTGRMFPLYGHKHSIS